MQVLGDIKRLASDLRLLQQKNHASLVQLGLYLVPAGLAGLRSRSLDACQDLASDLDENDEKLSEASEKIHVPKDGRAIHLPRELWKTVLSMGYLFVVTWITAFVMVIVHDRVPDMKKYPPLPDIFLDNVPHISWAFHMCEVTGSLLMIIWLAVLIMHKHR